ncbi:lipopolysaccharide biosynthesis protein, partial [Bacteroides uniformis]
MMSFSYALPQFPARVGSVMMVYSNRLFMVFFLTTSIIGLYSFSLKLASGVQILGTAFMMAWLPFMYQQFAKENHRLLFAKFMP